jgi:tetratricopeptide (TPR) repeat protein
MVGSYCPRSFVQAWTLGCSIGGERVRIFELLCGAVAAASVFTSSAHAQAQKSDLDRAMELVTSGKPEKSLALVDPIIAQAMLKDAKDPTAICPSAAAAFLQSYMEGKFTVTVENDWCDAMLVKGYALNELKRPAEAAQVLEALVRHDPANAHYLIEYAYTVRLNGQLERSLDLYKQAEKLASKLSDKASQRTGARWRFAVRGMRTPSSSNGMKPQRLTSEVSSTSPGTRSRRANCNISRSIVRIELIRRAQTPPPFNLR